MTSWTIRTARAEEADRLTEIAHAAKRHWNYPELWIRSWREDLTLTPHYVADNLVFAALGEGDSIARQMDAKPGLGGFYVLLPKDSIWQLEHLWVDPPNIGQGLGAQLLRHAIGLAKEGGAKGLEISSDPNAAGFYEHMGAQRIGEFEGSPLDGRPRLLPVYRLLFCS